MFWFRTCPVCDQGLLFIEEDIARQELVFHCDECEWVFRNAGEVESRRPSFLSEITDVDLRRADFATIQRYGWQKFAVHSLAPGTGT